MRYACKYGFFEIDSMPNQPSLALCHSFVVYEEYRGRGHGAELKQRQEDVLIDSGYTAAICTVQSSNTAQLKILNRFNWRQIDLFQDARNGQTVFTYMWRKPQ